MKPQLEVSTLLPSMLAKRLTEASKTPTGWDGGFSRAKEIERVTRQIKLNFPQYFRSEHETYHSAERSRSQNK